MYPEIPSIGGEGNGLRPRVEEQNCEANMEGDNDGGAEKSDDKGGDVNDENDITLGDWKGRSPSLRGRLRR